MSKIKELFFKEAYLENRDVAKEDIQKFIKYLNSAGDEGVQFDAKDVRKIFDKRSRFCLDRVKTELAKHVAAFTNTSGGLIAIGINETEKKKKINFRIDNFDLSKVNLQDFQRAISTSTEPKCEFTVEKVEMKKIGNKKYGIILLFIEQSVNPPHQAVYNRTYYFRHGESSNPAPHSLVSALFNYRKQPKLELSLIKIKNPNVQRFLIKNKGNAPALHTQIIVNIFPVIKKGNKTVINKTLIQRTTDGLWNIKSFLGNKKQNFMKFRFRASPSQILLPGVNEILFDIPVASSPQTTISTKVFCEGYEIQQEFNLF
jgi:hypothetical protein